MEGGFCTAALWDCITVAPCPHGEKASYKNLVSLSLSPLCLPHPASPYLSLHLCVCESSCAGRADWCLRRSNLTAAISVTAKKRGENRGKEKGSCFLLVFVYSCSEEVTSLLVTALHPISCQGVTVADTCDRNCRWSFKCLCLSSNLKVRMYKSF